MYSKILIANRGEIALRIIRTLREMGISSVAAYSDADRGAPFVERADAAYNIGPGTASASYLNQAALLKTALTSGAQALHPGYGFLAENADFAQAVAEAGLTFIGPPPSAIRLMGDKIAARRTAQSVGVEVVPGSDGPISSPEAALEFVRDHGLPVLVKAAGGGGGRGVRVVSRAEDITNALALASREAGTFFHNPEVYLERFYPDARHIEVQVVGDESGRVVAWGERDCSTQRRRQKLIEETPAPGVAQEERERLFDAACRCARAVDYVGVGTVEFLRVDADHAFFLEMNTRVQVEHTVTEMVTGLDLIREGVLISTGERASEPRSAAGHSIQARVNAEDPARGFAPGPGLISTYEEPGGIGVRIDSGVRQGFRMPPDYDSLMAKLIVHAPDRDAAIRRLVRAIQEYRIEGVPTTLSLIRNIIEADPFRSGRMTTEWLDAHLQDVLGEEQTPAEAGSQQPRGRRLDVEVNGRRFQVRILEEESSTGGVRPRTPRPSRSRTGLARGQIISPMHGTVTAVRKSTGDVVATGEAVFVVEAMKMENEIGAAHEGQLAAIHASVGDTVEVGQVLAEIQ